MEHSFTQEIVDRLARIETKQDATMEAVGKHGDVLAQHSVDIAKNDASTKSAHHRIDGIFATAGILGGAAGWMANFIAGIWPKGQ